MRDADLTELLLDSDYLAPGASGGHQGCPARTAWLTSLPQRTRYRYSPNILRYVLDREFERTDRTISRAESIGKMQISILLF